MSKGKIVSVTEKDRCTVFSYPEPYVTYRETTQTSIIGGSWMPATTSRKLTTMTIISTITYTERPYGVVIGTCHDSSADWVIPVIIASSFALGFLVLLIPFLLYKKYGLCARCFQNDGHRISDGGE